MKTYLVELEQYPRRSIIFTCMAESRDDADRQARSFCTHVIPDVPVCPSYIIREGACHPINCPTAYSYRKYKYGGCE